MTPVCDVEWLEEWLDQLLRHGGSERQIADTAYAGLRAMLQRGFMSLALLHAQQHGHRWDEDEQIRVVRDFVRHDEEEKARILCGNWLLASLICDEFPRLYHELFPRLHR